MKNKEVKTINNKIVPVNDSISNPEIIIKGIPSSPGIFLGKACIIKPDYLTITNRKIRSEEIQYEVSRFNDILNNIINEFEKIINNLDGISIKVYNVLESNLMILKDEFLKESIQDTIRKGYSAEASVVIVLDGQKQLLLSSKDSIIRDRAYDIDQIKDRFIRSLKNAETSISVKKDSVIVCQSITPTEIVKFRDLGMKAIITEVGGISSHSSILSRSLEITEVIGVQEATNLIQDDDLIIIDGYNGDIFINPSKLSIHNYSLIKKREKEHKTLLGELKKLPSETTDGKTISLRANVNIPEDIESLQMVGAEGIGLVRTEYMVLTSGKFPSEDEQYEWYNNLIQKCFPHPVTFRVFDLGSDKYVEGLPKHEDNPALGFRGIRFLLERKDIFATQIKAILRASKLKNARIMFPMVCTYYEMKETIDLINKCKRELSSNEIPFDDHIPLGIMIETPAAALIAPELAKHCDFFSIGTNDLTQYTLAADRTNELVSNHFDSFHPAVIMLIKKAVEAGLKENIEVAVCGEMAGHAAATNLLIGMGVTELSVAPSIIPELKKRIRESSYITGNKFAEDLLCCCSYSDFRKKLGLA